MPIVDLGAAMLSIGYFISFSGKKSVNYEQLKGWSPVPALVLIPSKEDNSNFINPEDFSVFPISGTFEYFCCYPDIQQVPKNWHFHCSKQDKCAQEDFKAILKKHKGDQGGYEVEYIVTHNIKKVILLVHQWILQLACLDL